MQKSRLLGFSNWLMKVQLSKYKMILEIDKNIYVSTQKSEGGNRYV